MKENFDNLCRVCLDAESDHVSIVGNHNVQLHLKSCLGIVVTASDKLPKTICVSCVSQLNSFYNIIQNARCSQDWLESLLEENSKTPERKVQIQPLTDCEYNSDSLLEFLNNTANIDEYLSNLGKEDIPSIVNMLDKNHETSMEAINRLSTPLKCLKEPSPKKSESPTSSNCDINMEIDVLDSDIEIVKEILMKETKTSENKTRTQIRLNEKSCHGCKSKFETLHKLAQHVMICDMAVRTCSYCFTLFDSRKKMLDHFSNNHCSCENQTKCVHKSCSSKVFPNFLFKCKRCGVAYEDRFLLYRHVKQHVMKDVCQVCDICGHKFNGDDELIQHKKDLHPSLENILYRCKICHETSKSRIVIYNHVKEHTLPKIYQRHLCETCGQCFTSKHSLQRHSQTKHHVEIPKKRRIKDSIDEVNFMCDSCGEIVTDSKILKSHTCADGWRMVQIPC